MKTPVSGFYPVRVIDISSRSCQPAGRKHGFTLIAINSSGLTPAACWIVHGETIIPAHVPKMGSYSLLSPMIFIFQF